MAIQSKTDLTPEQKITCAYLAVCRGTQQDHLAVAFGVNPGRVNEAIKLITKAVGLSDGGYKAT